MITSTRVRMICSLCKQPGHTKKVCPENQNVTTVTKKVKKTKDEINAEKMEKLDLYTPAILRRRFRRFKEDYEELQSIKEETGLPIRHQNPPEDITENIAKFVIQNHDNDVSCKWAKSVGLNGDLCSSKYSCEFPPEVKAFTSDGPSSFGPDKKFGAIYFVNMIDLIQKDRLIVWKANLTSESPEWKGVKMNKDQTFEDQTKDKRRPHISWALLYPQIKDNCIQIYDGSFEGIFEPAPGLVPTPAPIMSTVTDELVSE